MTVQMPKIPREVMNIQKAPVAVFIFNRPDNVSEVMKQVRLYKPETLLIVADGPRNGRPHERNLCDQSKQVALEVDWDCKILTNFSQTNLGCKKRLVSGIDWVFENVESAIILEDDCVPDPSFFLFAQEMLTKYSQEERVGMVSGNNYLFNKVQLSNSYYFSRYTHIWGWATWRRAWKLYDSEMTYWNEMNYSSQSSWLSNQFSSKGERNHWRKAFRRVAKEGLDTWDYQWAFTMFNNHLLSVVPKHNLIRNTGISAEATHTTKVNLESTAEVSSLNFPLVNVEGDLQPFEPADDFESSLLFRRTLIGRLRRNRFTSRRLKKQFH